MARLPNLLSLFRIALIPVLVWLLTDTGRGAALLAALVFFLACLSDFFDGWLARRHGIITTLGKFLDPLADKLIVMAALVMLACLDRQPRVPAWMVVLIVGRELAVTGLRAIASGEGVVLGAEELGKYKMIYQMFALCGLLLHYRFLGVDFHGGGMYFLWISLVISLWSGIAYHVTVARAVLQSRPPAGA
ncbi:MAG: CDP-diacylglycerol--glycerol-3-phosphate 3-phosphatidyltransferase [Deltaproteobacteria bacterium]|nr:CDP-diacylglycerol--glycerol-3-phosphate 3-phosphatidyltransferase [Deltaproteobacteria bacterium]MBI3390773.1 CDP-diacylglycerol--glycerol-3-phosphate 3-phosphatidyltransferase [Deltaproteobacteria bacterium]